MSSFRNLFGEPRSRWIAFGPLFEAFGAPWSPKVSQRWPEGSQGAHGSDQKGAYFRPKSGFGCITRNPKKRQQKRLKNTKNTHTNHSGNVPQV